MPLARTAPPLVIAVSALIIFCREMPEGFTTGGGSFFFSSSSGARVYVMSAAPRREWSTLIGAPYLYPTRSVTSFETGHIRSVRSLLQVTS